MEAAGFLQPVSAFFLNAAFAWMCGSWFSLNTIHWPAALACLLSTLLSLWAATAVMAGTGLAPAAALLPHMLVDTAYGRAGLAGVAAMLILMIAGRRSLLLAGLLLLGFAFSRALASHATGSMGILVAWLHLVLMGLWLGLVAVAAWLKLTDLRRLSSAATVALGGIVLTGFFNGWQRLQAPAQLIDHPYGVVLSVKLGLFLLAAALGAYNRFVGFPAVASGQGTGRATLVLRLESVVLLAVLAAAAVLATQEPPA